MSSSPQPAQHRPASVLVLTGLCLSALALASFALWQATEALEEATNTNLDHSGAVAENRPRPAPREFAAGLRLPPSTPREAELQRRLDDLERKLALVVVSSEGQLRKTAAVHDAERKRIKRDLKALHQEVGSLAWTMSQPIVPVEDGGSASAPDAGVGEEEEEDPEETADAGATEPKEEPESKAEVVRRDELLETLQEQTIKAGMKELAAFAGLSEDESAAVEHALRRRGTAHQQVITDVTAQRLSVRDASMRLEKINAEARKSLRQSLTLEQLQRFQDTISRLDSLLWSF